MFIDIEKEVYKRQKDLELTIPESVAIVGCGGIGWWIAKFVAMAGVQNLYLFDYDKIDALNLNRLDVTENHIGMDKSEVLAAFIKDIRPDTIISNGGKLVKENVKILKDVQFVFEATDHTHTQEMIDKYCKKNKIPICQVHYNGFDRITIEFGMSVESEWGDMPTTYQVVPSFVSPAVIAANMAIFKVFTENYKTESIKLK